MALQTAVIEPPSKRQTHDGGDESELTERKPEYGIPCQHLAAVPSKKACDDFSLPQAEWACYFCFGKKSTSSASGLPSAAIRLTTTCPARPSSSCSRYGRSVSRSCDC